MHRVVRFVAPWAVEAILVVAIIFLYQLTKYRVDVDPAIGLQHGRDVVGLERTIGLFVEPELHRFFADETSLMPVFRWLYLNLHFPVTLAFLVWLRYRHPLRYPQIRNGFALAHALALLVFILYPCAPPRMYPDYGFSEVLHLPYEGTHNPMAVIPSMHYGYASLVGFGLIWLARPWWLRALGVVYLALILFIIVVTAAHFIIDAPLGTLTVGLGVAATGGLRRDVE